MSALGNLVITLNANIARLEADMKKAVYITQQSARQMASSFDSIPGSIAKVGGAIAGLATTVGVFKAAINTNDEYRVSIIGIASALTNLSKPGQGSMENIFQRNIAHAKEMYEAIEKEASKHFAGPQDMMKAYNQLVQQGYAVRMEEVGALGTLTDKIKLATVGQDQEKQINQEIRALMEGQANAQSAVARELQTRLGPAWKDIVEQHKQAGDLLKYLESLWPGLGAASKEVQNTLESQSTTLKGQLAYLGREGLGGAYEDIVGLVKGINAYIREHHELVGYLQTGWGAIKEVASGVVTVVSAIASWIQTAWGFSEGLRASLTAIANQRADMGVTMGLDVSEGLMGPSEKSARARAQSEAEFGGYETAGEGLRKVSTAGAPPAIAGRPPDIGKGGGGGGKGGKDTTEQLEDYIRQLREDLGKAAGEGFSAVDAWFDKATTKIAKLATSTEQYERAMGVAQEVRVAKNQKVLDDFQKWYLDQTYQQTAVEKMELDKRLASVKGHTAEETKVREVMGIKDRERQVQLTVEVASETKKYIDGLAGVTTNIEQQNVLKMRSLELEQRIANIELERWIKTKEIPQHIADEVRALAALEAQAKKYDLTMKGEESRGSLTGWTSARARTAQGREGQGIAGLLTGAENFFQNAMSAGIQGVLTKDAKKLKQVGETMVAGFIGELNKKSVTSVFDNLAKILSPSTGGGNDMNSAADGLNKAAAGLQGSAMGFNSNSTQFGLAAGGLLLSGIGIATNSQALVIAGTVLQTVAMAVQAIMTLTSTSAAAALTSSAVALTGAAAALSAAAGGSGAGGILGGLGSLVSGLVLHGGGLIKAHSGYLSHDERLIIAQTGERVLSRKQTREYDAGYRLGDSQPQKTIVNHNNITVNLPNQTQAEIDRFARRLSTSLRRQENRRIA